MGWTEGIGPFPIFSQVHKTFLQERGQWSSVQLGKELPASGDGSGVVSETHKSESHQWLDLAEERRQDGQGVGPIGS